MTRFLKKPKLQDAKYDENVISHLSTVLSTNSKLNTAPALRYIRITVVACTRANGKEARQFQRK